MAERKPLKFAVILGKHPPPPPSFPGEETLLCAQAPSCFPGLLMTLVLAILQRAVGYVHVQQHPDGKGDLSYFWSQDDDICLGFQHPARHLCLQLNSSTPPTACPRNLSLCPHEAGMPHVLFQPHLLILCLFIYI